MGGVKNKQNDHSKSDRRHNRERGARNAKKQSHYYLVKDALEFEQITDDMMQHVQQLNVDASDSDDDATVILHDSGDDAGCFIPLDLDDTCIVIPSDSDDDLFIPSDSDKDSSLDGVEPSFQIEDLKALRRKDRILDLQNTDKLKSKEYRFAREAYIKQSKGQRDELEQTLVRPNKNFSSHFFMERKYQTSKFEVVRDALALEGDHLGYESDDETYAPPL